jgi:hypothetical protein
MRKRRLNENVSVRLDPTMKTLATILSVCALTALGDTTAPKSEVRETRKHFVVFAGDEILYEITEITRVSDALSAGYLLIRDTGHGDFVVRDTWTFEDQLAIHRMSDVKDRTFVQVSFSMPFVSKTRLDTMNEARENPPQHPAILKLETNGGRWDGVETDWSEYRQIRQLRRDLRRTVDFSLVEAIERMRGTLIGLPGLAIDPFFKQLARYVVYDSESDELQKDVQIRDAKPDCDFDASLGFPCSAIQRERAAKAAKSQKPSRQY